MIEKIVLTGSEGIIGRVLKSGLKEYEIAPIDLSLGGDVRDYQTLVKLLPGSRAIVHLAWETETENWRSPKANPDNRVMFKNIYQAALEIGVPKVIMASSVWADDWKGWKGPGLMSPYQKPKPQNAYGESKVAMENLGQKYASLGLAVICIRFGGVSPEDRPFERDKNAYLSHVDCVSLVQTAIKAKNVPNNFVIVYGVSNNPGKIHDTSNPWGWSPR